MASKKYKDKKCVYCMNALSTTTGDHIFAREFFLEKDRNNLPKVPACEKCNNVKSKLEHYLTTVLPFGGQQENASENLSTLVPRRLEKNLSLHRELLGKTNKIWLHWENNLYLPIMTLPFQPEYLLDLYRLIVRGLVWYHWDHYLTKNCKIEVDFVLGSQESPIGEIFQVENISYVKFDVGGRTFSYEGIQDENNREKTAWYFSLFGGAQFCGDPNMPDEIVQKVRVETGVENIQSF